MTTQSNTHMTLRIPAQVKKQFVSRCKALGTSASEEIRAFIEGQLTSNPIGSVSPKERGLAER